MTLYPPLAPAAALRWGGIAAAAVAILDQVTKALAHAALFSNPRVIEVTSFFNLVPVWNRGVSFGIFADGPEITRWLLTVFALVVSVILGLWMARGGRRLLVFGLALIIGGAIGNVIDRVRFGAVIDFVDLHAGGYHWPAFNIADAAIFCGVVMLIVENLWPSRHDDQEHRA